MVIDKIISDLEKKFPPALSAEWDKAGWQYKGSKKTTGVVVISLDITTKVVAQAIDVGANLIISHHPILFNTPVYLDSDTYPTSAIIKAIKSDISIYSFHTDIDSVAGGMNDYLAGMFGMKDTHIPQGNNNREMVFARVGTISRISGTEMIKKCRSLLDIDSVRIIGILPSAIDKLLVVSGSGNSVIKEIDPASFDIAITGDITYHDRLFFRENRYAILDVGHFIEKILFTKILQNSLEEIYEGKLVSIKSDELAI